MSDYILITDSTCDLDLETLDAWNIPCIQMTFTFDGDDTVYQNFDVPSAEFYARMRAGEVAHTSAINEATFRSTFSEQLEKGLDILYICFSSGLSGTIDAARNAADALMEAYPGRRIRVVDSLSASTGQGLLVDLCRRKRDEGCSLDEVGDFAEEIRLQVIHWFIVDDLIYLKRGGRIGGAAALFGSAINIKPVLYTANDGTLTSASKTRGRRKSIGALANMFAETYISDYPAPIYIGHGDCMEDAQYLAKLLKERYGAEVDAFYNIGPTVGAHSGPGTLALFYVGTERFG